MEYGAQRLTDVRCVLLISREEVITMASITKAELKAKRYEDKFNDTFGRWLAHVEVSKSDPVTYTNGDILIPATVYAVLKAESKFSDVILAQWRTRLPAKGHRSSTAFIGGSQIKAFSGKVAKIVTERDLGFIVSGEWDYAHWSNDPEYRARQEASVKKVIGK